MSKVINLMNEYYWTMPFSNVLGNLNDKLVRAGNYKGNTAIFFF